MFPLWFKLLLLFCETWDFVFAGVGVIRELVLLGICVYGMITFHFGDWLFVWISGF